MKNLKIACFIAMYVSCTQAMAGAQNTKFYGYINAYTEEVDDQPLPGGTKDESEQEYEVSNINAIVQSDFNNFKTYLNMTMTDGDPATVSNAWVQSDLVGDHLSIRFGKLYRRFGLYNEILDAVPTYIGIEPPELYDSDHLLLTRTTNLMLFGQHEIGPGYLNYSLMTGSDERLKGERPFGIDLNYQIGTKYKFGVSYYDTNGKAKSGTDYSNGGKGKPNGGVMPWMDEDEFTATGVYFQFIDTNWTVQVAGYSAPHKGVRNSANIQDICDNYGSTLTSRHQSEFNCGGTINTDADYTVETYYTRIGYNFYTQKLGQITPYIQYDYYKNEETVGAKAYHGDNEAGHSDDGSFVKWTVGSVFRPEYNIALKTDYSQHVQDIDNKSKSFGEVRLSFSYFWSL